jgi:hypothetical protein
VTAKILHDQPDGSFLNLGRDPAGLKLIHPPV